MNDKNDGEYNYIDNFEIDVYIVNKIALVMANSTIYFKNKF